MMRRTSSVVVRLGLVLPLLLAASCSKKATSPTEPMGQVQLLFQANVSTASVSTLVVEVTAPDIDPPLIFNIEVINGVATGTIVIPTGSDRTITVRAFDTKGIETHRGSDTVDVVEGTNPPLEITLEPLTGELPLVVTFGSLVVLVEPATVTLGIGGTVQLTATVVDAGGDTLSEPVVWATSNPGIATVDTTGLVLAMSEGEAVIMATFGGVGGAAEIAVLGVVPPIAVTSPNGGESWLLGSTHSVTWSGGNPYTTMKIELYKAGSLHSTITTGAANNGTYSWTIPTTLATGSDYRVKITDEGNSANFDSSDGDFSILAPPISVTWPNGGESLRAGSYYYIRWTGGTPGGTVTIELYKASSLHSTITSSAPNTGTYHWPIASSHPTGLDYRVKVIDGRDTSNFDSTDGYFRIYAPLHVSSPRASDNWVTGRSYTITWSGGTSGGGVMIQLYYGSSLRGTIVSGTANDGSYTWTVGSVSAGNSYRIKITELGNSANYAFSSGYFRIAYPMYVIYPNGGERWPVGSTRTIRWSGGTVGGGVRIELWQGGSYDSTITSGTANDGGYSWSPGLFDLGSGYRIKIIDLTNTSNYDYSNSSFSIVLF